MKELLIFVIGAWIGVAVGIIAVALCAAGRRKNDG